MGIYHLNKDAIIIILTVILLVILGPTTANVNTITAGPPYMGNGIKIGEVTPTSAIIWTRLTQIADFKTDGVDFTAPKTEQNPPVRQIPIDKTIADMNTSLPGVNGQVNLTYWPNGAESKKITSAWIEVAADQDFTRQFILGELTPATRYSFTVQGRAKAGAPVTVRIESSLTTAPPADQVGKIVFTVVTGSRWDTRDDAQNGQQIYPQMKKLNPDFFVHTGDIVYYDKYSPWVENIELARLKWNRMYALPFVRQFHRTVPAYFIKDDHDTLQDDCWSSQRSRMGDFTWQQGLAVFREQVPFSEKTYRTFRWGKDLQIWTVEGRDFRSANTDFDGPDKTIWGKQQMEWFKKTVQESDATFRILISPTPIVGPDRQNKKDNHANQVFAYEGDLIRQFISQQKNMAVICGDRHWQYLSVDPETNLREYSCGPTTDLHAGGFTPEDRSPMHRYLNIKGGFLSVTIDCSNNQPTAAFRHHAVDGSIYHQDVQIAK